MLYINNNSSAELVVTLREKSTNLVNPYYTWKIINKDTLTETVFYVDNHSPSSYYDAFTVSVSATMSGLTAGILNCGYGQFTYQVYEMTNQYDLNLNNAVGLVETGLLIIGPTLSTPATWTQSSSMTVSTYNNLDRI